MSSELQPHRLKEQGKKTKQNKKKHQDFSSHSMMSCVSGTGCKRATPKAKAVQIGTSAGLGVGVQVRGIMGEKVLLLIAALEQWPAWWSTKGPSDTLQWLGLVNISLTSGMPHFSPHLP